MKTLNLIKVRFLAIALAVVSVILSIPSSSASAAENYNGGWAFSKGRNYVYDAPSGGNQIGYVDREGVTVLSQSGSTYYIEYSTSSGPKRGYVRNPNMDTSSLSSSCVAKITVGSSLYYGPNTSTYHATGGSVSAGEYVAVIAKENNWVYVEYNTNSGRKRGYMLYSNLSCFNRPGYFADFYMSTGRKEVINTNIKRDVFYGPNESYVGVGYIDSSDKNVPCYSDYYYGNGETFHYIEYSVNGKLKSGYIRWDTY